MWDERYSAPGFAYGRNANDFLVSLGLKAKEGQKVLCLAEGEGRNAVYLAQLGFEVLAVDQSSVGLQKATRLTRDLRYLLFKAIIPYFAADARDEQQKRL